MNTYHAHIYFDVDQKDEAKQIYDKAIKLQNTIFEVYRFYDKKVGPHHLPMFEMHFSENTKIEVIEWLKTHQSTLSILIHQDTGDDVLDHKQNVIWLGKEIPINFDFFELVKRDPSQSIHPIKT